jgi:hypothetical protein
MILPDFILHSRVNQEWQYAGLDSIKHCLDKKHFESYPYQVNYKYNSRGFRDAEWPTNINELKQAVWCVGDSFTVGIGSPLEHTWPYQVGKQLGRRTINVSMDGASNEWIARKVLKICEVISPELAIIQWSYVHRRENENSALRDEDRRIHHRKTEADDDIKHTLSCIKTTTQVSGTQILHSFIPQFAYSKNNCYATIKQTILSSINTLPISAISEIQQLDVARDGHHYDILTAKKFSNTVCELLTNRRQ